MADLAQGPEKKVLLTECRAKWLESWNIWGDSITGTHHSCKGLKERESRPDTMGLEVRDLGSNLTLLLISRASYLASVSLRALSHVGRVACITFQAYHLN